MDAQTIIAKRIAQELRPGMLINLGIGIPTLVANYVPQGVNVFFQSENGLIGTGPIPEEGMAHPTLTDAGGRPSGTAFLAPAPFGLKLLIGLAAVDDGPEVRYLPIVGDLAFGSAHGVPPLWLLLRRPLSVANIAWSALDALPPETKIFTFRDIEGQRSLRDQPHGTLTKLPTATKICPTPRDSLLASMNECGVKRGFHESQYRDRLHSG